MTRILSFLSLCGLFLSSVMLFAQSPSDDGERSDTMSSLPERTSLQRRLELPFLWTGQYNLIDEIAVPDTTVWISQGATVVDGVVETWNPRIASSPIGEPAFSAPVIRLDRKDAAGQHFYNDNAPGLIGGDTLTSMPINIPSNVAELFAPYLLFSYQRGGKMEYNRGWSDQVRFGPEAAVYNVTKTSLFQIPDNLIVEFAEPQTDPSDESDPENWSQEGFLDNSGALPADQYWGGLATPRWGVFGGGGGQDTAGRIVVESLDGGADRFFRKAWVPIPLRYLEDTNAAKRFRFRFRVIAKNDGRPEGQPMDDEDAFYIDDIWVRTLDHPEVGITGIEADIPWTEITPAQATAIPLRVHIYNNDATWSGMPVVELRIENLDDPTGEVLYRESRGAINIRKGEHVILEFPSWDAAKDLDEETAQGKTVRYGITAEMKPHFDKIEYNDYYQTDLKIRFGPTLAYDMVDAKGESRNEVEQMSGIPGRGLGLSAPYPDPAAINRYGASSGVGAMAIPFRLNAGDTIKGYQVWYGSASQIPQNVLLQLYRIPQGTTSPESKPVPLAAEPGYGFLEETKVVARRGVGLAPDNIDAGEQLGLFDQYMIHPLARPYAVEPGEYYIVITQLPPGRLELGGSGLHQGAKVLVADPQGNGGGNENVILAPQMQDMQVWYSNGTTYDEWYPMLSRTGISGFPHLNSNGTINEFATYQQGSWMPMVRPRFDMGNYQFDTSASINPVSEAGGTGMRILPNPVSDRMRILLHVPESGRVRIELCDLYGTTVGTGEYLLQGGGDNVLTWEMTDERGEALPSGTYFYRVSGEGMVLVEKVILVE